MKSSKVGILSLGCPRNLVDSEEVLGRLCEKGYKITDIAKADTALINTCAFIDEAKKESIEAILDLVSLKEEGRLKKIIVMGCLVQRFKDKLRKELPEVDAFMGRVSLNHGFRRFALTDSHYAYLKISEGCLNRCSFCVIPAIKGKFASLDFEAVLKRTKYFNQMNLRELNIIGQDITGYGMDLYGRRRLPELVRGIIKQADRIGWIRLLYFYPDPVINELLEIMKDEPRICRYIDLPIQHINSRILKLMNRRLNKKDILELIDRIRKKVPGIVLRTSLIVGFPSETDREFKELLDFVDEVKFERLGAFVYSREEGTPAYNFKGQIPVKVKSQRLDTVMSLQQEIAEKVNTRFLGSTLDVLIEEKKDDYYLGRSQFDAPEVDGVVYVKTTNRLKPGDFIPVKITDTLEYDLVGKPLSGDGKEN